MWKQANLENGNANHGHAHKHIKTLKSLGIILLLLVSASIVFVKPGLTQATITMKVEPTFIGGKYLDIFEVQLRFYGANYTEGTAVSMWQAFLTWSPAVLELNSTVVWGDFLDGYRIGEWGLLLYDAAALQNRVYVTDGSGYQIGNPVLIKDDVHQETNTITDVVGNMLILQNNLVYSYTVADNAGCYPDPATTVSASISQSVGRILCGVTTQGTAPGAQGDGLLATLKFVVQQNVDSPISIDSENTLITNSINEVLGDEPGELNKVSSYFLAAQPGDARPDGLIDVFDVFSLGKDWQKCPRVTKIPTTVPSGAWTNPTYAYMTDDLRATSATSNQQQVYGGFGFVTTLWTGVTKVEVGVERSASSTACDDSLRIEISPNNGGNWYGATAQVVNYLSDRFTWFDFTGATAWTKTGVSNIAVRITFVKGDNTLHTIRVDWITVRVTPSPATLYGNYADANADGLVNAPDLTIQAASYGLDYRP